MKLFDDAAIFGGTDPVALLEPLRRAFLGDGHAPPRLHEDLPGEAGAKLLVMPSWAGREWLGVKVATVFPGNPARGRPTVNGSYLLMDGATGAPLALLSAPALTMLRTAAVSALAASLLAREDARTLLMIGTGALAPHLVRAHCGVRPIARVLLWGRDPAKAAALAARLAGLPARIEVIARLEEGLKRADVISSATLARHPLIAGESVAAGAHVDLVGGFTPDMREADDALFRRGHLVVDTAVAFRESGDLLGPVARGVMAAAAPDLAAALRDPRLARHGAGQITIFKSVGTAIADLAAARHVFESHSREDREGDAKLSLDFG